MFTLIKYLRNKFVRRANLSDIGKKVAVLWNPQGVRDFGDKPVLREGVIDSISPDGGFDIKFDSGAIMIVCAMFHGYRKNPFRNVTIL